MPTGVKKKIILFENSAVLVLLMGRIDEERMLHEDYYRKGSVEKRKGSPVVSLKGLDAKMN
jgi:hypothetical protein